VHGLSAAGLAADQGAPILVVGDDVPGATAELVRSCGRPRADLLLVGDERVISGAVADDLGRAASGC
jgi:glycosyltransferase A (GT-A) superfamily protein (DUF2064 family)